MDEFLMAYSDLAVEILDAMKEAIIEYRRDNDLSDDSLLDEGALARAAEAYRRAVGIPQRITSREVARMA